LRVLAAISCLGFLAATAGDSWNWGRDGLTGFQRLEQLDRAAESYPSSAYIQRRRLEWGIGARNPVIAADALTALGQQEYALPQDELARLRTFVPPPVIERYTRRANDWLRPFKNSRELVTVPARYPRVAGVAWDQRQGRLYLSTADGLVLRQRGQTVELVTRFNEAGLFGMAVDAPRQRLWVAAAPTAGEQDLPGRFRGLVEFDLKTGKIVRRYAAPAAKGTPSDVAVAGDGTVFVSDATEGAVYVLSPGKAELATLVHPGRMVRPRGMAIGSMGMLYVADQVLGLARVHPRTGEIWRVQQAGRGTDGICGLATYGNSLVGVQNEMRPQRIMRFFMGRGGREVRATSPWEVAHPGWRELGRATVGESELIYISGASSDCTVSPNGSGRRGQSGPTQIRAMRLEPSKV